MLQQMDVRDAFFAAAAEVDSEGDRARILIQVLEVEGDGPAVSVGALQATRGIAPGMTHWIVVR